MNSYKGQPISRNLRCISTFFVMENKYTGPGERSLVH